MARRRTLATNADVGPGTYITATEQAEHLLNIKARCVSRGDGVVARAHVERSVDYDPATDTGTWTRVGAASTNAVNGRAAAVRELPEAARPRGGFVRLVLEVAQAPLGVLVEAELWAEASVYETGVAEAQRVPRGELDDRLDLTDPAV